MLAFVRSAELGSFAAAAKQLDMSAAAVGQAVVRLERGFGVKLLNRTTRRMSVTVEGKEVLERASRLVGELAELQDLFGARGDQIVGPLRVSAPLGLARRHVLPIVARFAQQHPAVEVSLDCSDVVRDFVGDPIDVGFRILRPKDSSIVARRIAQLPAVCVASPDYLRRHGTPARPSDLSRHACIGYRHPGSGVIEPMRFRAGGRDQTATLRPSLVVNDVETGCRAAALGLGIAQPPAYYVQHELGSGELVPILERHAPPPWTLYLCYPGAKQLPQRVRAFIDFARDALASERFS